MRRILPHSFVRRSLILGFVLPALMGVLAIFPSFSRSSEESGAAPKPAIDEAWSEPAILAPQSLLIDAVADGDRVIAVGERGHVLLSEDRGFTWKQIPAPTRSMLTAITKTDDGKLWAVGHDAVILHSSDGGRSWVRQFSAPENETPFFDVWFENPQHGIALGAYGLFFETQDGGKTWEARSVDEQERHWNGITQTPDGTLYVAGELGVVFRSSDKGKTWAALSTPYQGTFFGTSALPDGTVLVYGLRGNVYRSADKGETWEKVPTGTTATLLGGGLLPDGSIILVGLSGTILISQDNGKSFQLLNLPDRRGISTAISVGTDDVLLVGEGGARHKSILPNHGP